MNRFFLFSILFFSLFIVACEEPEIITDSNSFDPVIDSELADSLVEEANDELYDELMWLAETEPPEDPSLIDEWLDLSDAYEYASNVMVQNMLKIDAEEGIDAFINKRKPKWQDK